MPASRQAAQLAPRSPAHRTGIESCAAAKAFPSWPEDLLIGSKQHLRVLFNAALAEISHREVQFLGAGVPRQNSAIQAPYLRWIVSLRFHALRERASQLMHERAVHQKELLQR